MLLNQLKVSKFQKQIFLFSFEPKTEHFFFEFFPSLLNESNQKKLMHFIILIKGYLIQQRH